MKDKSNISRWETMLSDLDLCLVSLTDQGSILTFIVEGQDDRHYEVVFENKGPYRVTDEQYLQAYWAVSEPGRGSTFKVQKTEWGK